ncbi:hypothetical protein DBR43_31175 [Pedobacter sp. KBW06]|uniref:hypothetical protein n=1 Tax=Pedobacter sp. KBW06 TaxID=2153359 RepID=UPI000F5A0176|nr:hypothetical protein [Pedobacter sp. KBW06]RQO65308.1 hypothetical protein DBR43_31175 [Pedobacter sp. KBW06]
MKEHNHNSTNLEFRKVYLSDMRSVINLYQKTTERSVNNQQLPQDQTIKLTADFGLPLSIVSDDKEVIGFAFATINEQDEVVLNSRGLQQHIPSSIGDELIEEAKRTLDATFGDLQENNTKLKHSIYKLVDWLNTCQ